MFLKYRQIFDSPSGLRTVVWGGGGSSSTLSEPKKKVNFLSLARAQILREHKLDKGIIPRLCCSFIMSHDVKRQSLDLINLIFTPHYKGATIDVLLW